MPAMDRIRRFRFSLRTVMIVITLMCVVLGVRFHHARQQRDAMAELARLGDPAYAFYHCQMVPTNLVHPGTFFNVIDVDRSREPAVRPFLKRIFGVDFFHDVVAVDFSSREGQGAEFKQDVLGALQQLPRLEYLALSYGITFDDTDVAKLASIRDLRELQFDNASALTDASLAALSRLANLESLEFKSMGPLRFTDQALDSVGRMKNLRYLDLGITGFSDEGLKPLAGLSKLEVLSLWSEEIKGPGCAEIGRLKNLRKLVLIAPISDEGLAQLGSLQDLELLDISNASLSGRGFESLQALPKLMSVTVVGKDVSDATPQWLSKLPQLETLAVSGDGLTLAGLESLRAAKNLTWLRLDSRFRDQIPQLSAMLPNCVVDTFMHVDVPESDE